MRGAQGNRIPFPIFRKGFQKHGKTIPLLDRLNLAKGFQNYNLAANSHYGTTIAYGKGAHP